MVGTNTTGQAESVRITFDPRRISYGQMLQIYFSVAHDPTELNRQGPDVGSQYRSAIFPTNPQQMRIAEAYIVQLNQAHCAKGGGQGEREPMPHVPDTVPGKRVTDVGARTEGRGQPSNIRGGSRMQESCPYGSVRGAPSNGCPYRNPFSSCCAYRPF
jgi:hypothetical protein